MSSFTDKAADHPSDSALRIADLEAKLAAMSTRTPKLCKWVNTKEGCYVKNCKFYHPPIENTAILKKKLAEKEKELEDALKFSEMRSAMNSKLVDFGKKFAKKFSAENSLELVFVMDCTGSMNPWIEEAKKQIVSIFDNVKRDHENAAVKVGFVAYRDYCDGAMRIEAMRLTKDIPSVVAFISKLTAFGGGDGPEDIPGGLKAAIEMEWTANAKCIVLVADAPCHGREYHDSSDDETYRRQYDQSPDIKAQMRYLSKNGFDFTFIDIQPDYCSKMVSILRREYSSVESKDGVSRTFTVTELSGHADVVKFAKTVYSSASSSLSASKSRSVLALARDVKLSTYHHYGPTGKRSSAAGGLSTIHDDDDEEEETESTSVAPNLAPLNWDEIEKLPEINAIRHSLHVRPDGVVINWENPDFKHTTQSTKIRLSSTPFAKGAMSIVHGMIDSNMNKRFAAKFYYGKAKRGSKEEDLAHRDVEMQVVAKQLAVAFSCSKSISQGIDFIFTTWYEINDRRFGGKRYFTAEPFIVGEYVKFHNNSGWVNPDLKGITAATAGAFSHFTWQHTYGKIIVVDIQGVNSICTDPQIHSLNGERYGRGNLMEPGILSFFHSHECNEICSALRLAKFKSGKSGASSVPDEKLSSVLSYESAPDMTMECSCPLCGEIIETLHSIFLDAYEKNREVYCRECELKLDDRQENVCVGCSETFTVSLYWYSMKGMEPPKSCKKCKKASTKKKHDK